MLYACYIFIILHSFRASGHSAGIPKEPICGGSSQLYWLSLRGWFCVPG